MITVTTEEDPKIQAGNVCLLFTAPWCGPCRMLKPSLEKQASSLEPIEILGVDVDTLPQLATRYGVKSVPTAILLKDGEQQGQLHGIGEITVARIKSFFE